MFPDAEIPIMLAFFRTRIPHRLVLHSLLGAATIGTLTSMLITIHVYPALITAIFPIDKLKVKGKHKPSLTLCFSCLIGNVSHVSLDIINHPYNPIFWPFLTINETPSPICFALGGMENASLAIHAILTVLFTTIFISNRKNLWEKLLVK